GFALLVRMPYSSSRWPAVVTGVLFAIASLYKQIAVVPAALLCAGYVATAKPALRKKALGHVLAIGAVGALVWTLVFGYFAVAGRMDDFLDAVFFYNQAYAGDLIANLTRAFTKPVLPAETLTLLALLGAFSLTGVIIAF